MQKQQPWSITTTQQIRTASAATNGLTLLQPVLAGLPGQAMLHLLRLLSKTERDPGEIATAYGRVFHALASVAQDEQGLHLPPLPDTWQAYLTASLLDSSTLWSRGIERGGKRAVSQRLRDQARRDLSTLQRLFALDAQALLAEVQAVVASDMPVLKDAWEPWRELTSLEEQTLVIPERDALAYQIRDCEDWGDLLPALEAYWERHGTGPLAHYHILRWETEQKHLAGIAHPDPVLLSNLVGQQRQQARLMANIERFLARLPAHDMLLYGPPGTGKSSTLKALVNTYAPQGLRLVEIRRDDIAHLPQIVMQLRSRAPRYLLFIDDLSFEEHETGYKVLKVLLEGTAEARPHNILIGATSNRLNLIRESFSERGKPTDDVNWRDTMDEKQSLAHRFGLRVTFFSPDQQQYLTIVAELARQRNITLAEDELQERALQWERQHAGRSGRVARQFIDDLEADLKLQQPVSVTTVQTVL